MNSSFPMEGINGISAFFLTSLMAHRASYYVRVAGIAPAVAEAIYGYGKVVDERYDGCSYFVERADEKALAEAARKVEAVGGSVKLVLKRLPEEA